MIVRICIFIVFVALGFPVYLSEITLNWNVNCTSIRTVSSWLTKINFWKMLNNIVLFSEYQLKKVCCALGNNSPLNSPFENSCLSANSLFLLTLLSYGSVRNGRGDRTVPFLNIELYSKWSLEELNSQQENQQSLSSHDWNYELVTVEKWFV